MITRYAAILDAVVALFDSRSWIDPGAKQAIATATALANDEPIERGVTAAFKRTNGLSLDVFRDAVHSDRDLRRAIAMKETDSNPSITFGNVSGSAINIGGSEVRQSVVAVNPGDLDSLRAALDHLSLDAASIASLLEVASEGDTNPAAAAAETQDPKSGIASKVRAAAKSIQTVGTRTAIATAAGVISQALLAYWGIGIS